MEMIRKNNRKYLFRYLRMNGHIQTRVYMICNHVHDTLFTFVYTCLLNNSKRKNTNEFS